MAEKKSFKHDGIPGWEFEDINMAGTQFTNINLSGSRFHDINFSDVLFTAAQIGGNRFSAHRTAAVQGGWAGAAAARNVRRGDAVR